jgi:5-formyltetrahydrofolate cyclo-ligase
MEPIQLREIDVLIVPGLAFDSSGGRLGQGGGFYDRLLARADGGAMTVGVAFGLQILPDVPQGPTDQNVDAVITESGYAKSAGLRPGPST